MKRARSSPRFFRLDKCGRHCFILRVHSSARKLTTSNWALYLDCVVSEIGGWFKKAHLLIVHQSAFSKLDVSSKVMPLEVGVNGGLDWSKSLPSELDDVASRRCLRMEFCFARQNLFTSSFVNDEVERLNDCRASNGLDCHPAIKEPIVGVQTLPTPRQFVTGLRLQVSDNSQFCS